MNKKIRIILFITLTLFVFVYFFTVNKNTKPLDNFNTIQISDNTQEGKSTCEKLDLPEGSYVYRENACYPTEKHFELILNISKEEYDSGNEHELAYIKNIYGKNGEIYLDADYFQWIGCTYSSEKIGCENGYMILNENEKIRTFKLDPNVKIRLMREFGNIYDLKTFSPQEAIDETKKPGNKFYAYENESINYIPFTLILKNGEIKFIHQIYTP